MKNVPHGKVIQHPPEVSSTAWTTHQCTFSSNVLSTLLASHEPGGQVHLGIKTHMASSPARRGKRQESSVGEEKETMRRNVDSGQKLYVFCFSVFKVGVTLFIKNVTVWVTWEKVGKTFAGKESQSSTTVKFSDRKFRPSLETLEEYKVWISTELLQIQALLLSNYVLLANLYPLCTFLVRLLWPFH